MIRLGYAIAVVAAILISIVNGLVGWATSAYNWHAPLFIFTNGLMVITWIGIIAIAHLECGRRHQAEEVDSLRRQRSEEVASLRRSQDATRKAVQELREQITTLISEVARTQLANRYLQTIDGAERRLNVVPLGDRQA